MEILSINSAILVFHGTIVTLFIALGRPRLATAINFLFVVILVAGLSMLVSEHGAVGAAWSMLIACVLSTPVYLLQAWRHCGVPLGTFIAGVLRPTVAGIVMVWAVREYLPTYEVGMAVTEAGLILAIAIAIGATSYGVSLLLLWAVSGLPDGAEKMIYSKIQWRVKAMLGKPDGNQD
jgi:O-antigen/teichoic acid export membrane protein